MKIYIFTDTQYDRYTHTKKTYEHTDDLYIYTRTRAVRCEADARDGLVLFFNICFLLLAHTHSTT